MPRRAAPPPSRAAERLRERLDVFDTAQQRRGKAWYDFYRRAGDQWGTYRWIKYLEENGLIMGSRKEGYLFTDKGETWRYALKRHRDLVGVFTRGLGGDRRKRL